MKATDLSHGRQLLAIPGPTTVPDSVLQAMHRPAVDLYHKDMAELGDALLEDIKWVCQTQHKAHMYIANGHGAWEAALTNTLCRGDKVLVVESGRFARGWGDMGTWHNLEIETVEGDDRASVDLAALKAKLKADTDHDIKAILVCQIDTASSVVNHIPDIRDVIKACNHPALFMVDTIASLATMPYEMDAWDIDVTVGAVQKGLMSSPGISFTCASPKAMAAHQSADLRSLYWDWSEKEKAPDYKKYCGTPPEHLLFGLAESTRLLKQQGLDSVFARHQVLAYAVRAAVTVWGEQGALEFNILDETARSNAVTTVLTHGFDPELLRAFCLDKLGVVLGTGIGEWGGRAFRIAHMGHVNAAAIMGTLGAIDVALKALSVPHGEGALNAASKALVEGLS